MNDIIQLPKKLNLNQKGKLKNIRRVIIFFIISLLISGITAFPIQFGLDKVIQIIQYFSLEGEIASWIITVEKGVSQSYHIAPFIAYGSDWLAFSHIVIATVFIGPLIDPIRNKWVILFGMISCVMVFPLAFIAGPVREIPFLWQIIDCSFGVFGFLTLWVCYKSIQQLENNILSNSITHF